MTTFLLTIFLILLIENRLKPRLFKTIYGDWILWYTFKGKRKFWKL